MICRYTEERQVRMCLVRHVAWQELKTARIDEEARKHLFGTSPA
jgi:hypothetical protein